MINKVNSVDANFKAHRTNITASKKANVNATQVAAAPKAGAKFVGAFQAMNGIAPSFGAEKSKNGFTELEKSIIGDKEIKIPDLLNLTEDIDLPIKEMPADKAKFNAAGLNVVRTIEDDKKIVTVSNDKGNVLLIAKVDKNRAELPTVTYRQGKFLPEVTVTDPSLGDKAVKMLAGSELIGDGFSFKMPGKYQPIPGGEAKSVSFKGNTVISTLNKEARTLNAVESYMKSELPSLTVDGDYKDEVIAADATVVIPAGGFGERFYNIAGEAENKPSAKMPTRNEYRVMATALNLAAAAGIINGDKTDNVKYLSQAHEIPNGGDVRYVDKYKTDGGAIAEGLVRDIIPNDKPAIILNADIFTNADITRTFHALQTLPDAALVIPYYPVNADRAKSFGLLGIEKDANNNLQIKEFLEKPKYTDNPPMPDDFVEPGDYDKAMEQFTKVQTAVNPDDEQSFLANPGFYLLSPQALKVLTAKGILDPKGTGLGAHVMPEIVRLANEGKLLDAEGNKMKVYTVPLEAKGGQPAVWDDIGTAEAYLKLVKDVANEYTANGNTKDNKYYGVPEFVMSDFAKNTDAKTGIVYDSQEAKTAFDNFKQTYNVTTAQGNIYVAA